MLLLFGIVMSVAGFLLSLMSLSLASGTGPRLALVLVGIAVSLFGILGMVNSHFLKNVLWKR